MPIIVTYILGILTAIAATVLICIFILPEKKREKLNKFFKTLHDIFNFRQLLLEKILKITYVFFTVLCIVTGLLMIISVQWVGTTVVKYFGLQGLILLVCGPVILRIIYEAAMMFIILVRNSNEINNKLPAKEECCKEEPEKAAEPAEEYVPNLVYCTKCGTQYDANLGGCPNGCEQ